MNAQANNYNSLFHSSAFYPEAKAKKNEQHLNGVIYKPDLENRKPDLRNPDRMIKNIFPRPRTQLMLFSIVGQVDKVKKLLKKGADPNKKANDNSTALICATGNPQGQECAKLLLAHDKIAESINAMTHRQKKTALSNAIELGNVELVQLLVDKGADLNLKATLNEYTPLYQAVHQLCLPEYYDNLKDDPTWHNKNFDPVKAGISFDSIPSFLRGSMVFDADYANGEFQSRHRMKENSDLHSALCQAMGSTEIDKRGNIIKVIDILLDAKPDLEVRHINKFTVLMLACELGESEIFKKLILLGADVNVKDKGDSTPLIYAAHAGHSEIVKLLIESGADINQKNEAGYNGIELAMHQKHQTVVKLLLENYNAIPKENDIIVNSIFNKAIEYGYGDMIQELFQKKSREYRV
ncbi:ankyrin repeat domain-containing protein [Desulfobacterales bacterium HSG16]|nr:ankyrin repeat domain-containing protein [Desulfobacterales bacterium HSG16]